MEKKAYTVSQINKYIKSVFTRDYALSHIYIRGEVSNCKYHTSGHIYFTLKDSKSQITCVMFATYRNGLTFRLSEGQNVVVLGSISVYERDGKYQLYAEEIILDGIGMLFQRFEELKQVLGEEGLFSEIYKKPIPAYCGTVGIVTASTGAAIQDIIHISHRRNPYVQLILYPALVQGQGAKESIIKGIQKLDTMSCDVIIVGRGGGSLEDLWAFNEEEVVRAIFNCTTPVISAVGHETDTMLSDYVADLRAPTPSAAAELANIDIRSLLYTLEEQKLRLTRKMKDKVERERNSLSLLSLKLTRLSPQYLLQEKKQFLDSAREQLLRLIMEKLQNRRHCLEMLSGKLHAKMPMERLRNGYAYVTIQDLPLATIEQVNKEDIIHITVRDGELKAQVKEITKREIKKEKEHGKGNKNAGTIYSGTASSDRETGR